MPITCSPTCRSVCAPSPSSTSSPATSMPGTYGKSLTGSRRAYVPLREYVSVGFTVAAVTRSRTWPGPSGSAGTSTRCRVSGPPNSVTPTALMPSRYPGEREPHPRQTRGRWGVSSALGGVVLEQAPADDGLLDLAGALADQQERRLAHQPLDLVLLGVAVAAVDAEGLLRDLSGELTGDQLGHAGLDVVALPGVLQPRRPHHHRVRGLDLGRHLGQPERDRLVLGDRAAERLPLLRVVDGRLERPDRDTAATGGDVDPAELEAVH